MNPESESFPAFVRRHAENATRVRLLLVVAVALGFLWLADQVRPHTPLLALAMMFLVLSVVSTALWGLTCGHPTRLPSRGARWAGSGLLVLGMLGLVVAALVLLFALLGRPWVS